VKFAENREDRKKGGEEGIERQPFSQEGKSTGEGGKKRGSKRRGICAALARKKKKTGGGGARGSAGDEGKKRAGSALRKGKKERRTEPPKSFPLLCFGEKGWGRVLPFRILGGTAPARENRSILRLGKGGGAPKVTYFPFGMGKFWGKGGIVRGSFLCEPVREKILYLPEEKGEEGHPSYSAKKGVLPPNSFPGGEKNTKVGEGKGKKDQFSTAGFCKKDKGKKKSQGTIPRGGKNAFCKKREALSSQGGGGRGEKMFAGTQEKKREKLRGKKKNWSKYTYPPEGEERGGTIDVPWKNW